MDLSKQLSLMFLTDISGMDPQSKCLMCHCCLFTFLQCDVDGSTKLKLTELWALYWVVSSLTIKHNTEHWFCFLPILLDCLSTVMYFRMLACARNITGKSPQLANPDWTPIFLDTSTFLLATNINLHYFIMNFCRVHRQKHSKVKNSIAPNRC